MILVSVGGGQLGHALLESIVETSLIIERYIPHHIQVFTGPFIPDEKFIQLQKAAKHRSNLTIRKYTSQLLAYMKKASLSISMCGYNTTMNIISTGVTSLVLPSNKDWEQKVRAEKLEKLKIVKVIHSKDLQPVNLAKQIIENLRKEAVVKNYENIDMQGAQKTSALLKELLQTKVSAAYSAA